MRERFEKEKDIQEVMRKALVAFRSSKMNFHQKLKMMSGKSSKQALSRSIKSRLSLLNKALGLIGENAVNMADEMHSIANASGYYAAGWESDNYKA